MGGITTTGRVIAGQPRWSREAAAKVLLLALLLILLPLLLASQPRILNDGDVSWHIATGRWMFEHGRIPTTDPFSFTAAGQPWVDTEWLADLIFASAYGLGSFAGLSVIVAACFIALNGILFAYLRSRVGPIAFAAAVVAADIVLIPFILARPHVLVWPLLAGWTVFLLRAAETGRPPALWSVLLLVVWTNIHASFPLALPIALGIAFDSLRQSQWKEWRAWTGFILVSVIALLLNANGIAGLMQPFRITNLGMLPLIQEWKASTPSFAPQFYAVLLLGLGAMLYKGVRVPAGQLAVLLLMLLMAFSHIRHQSWFIIVVALVLPPLFRGKPAPMPAAAPFALAALPLLALRAVLPLTPMETPSNPWQLLAQVPQGLRTQPVFNGYSFGGPLIRSGIKPYIDGRADLYGDAFVTDYNDVADGDWVRFNEVVRHYGIRWTILPSGTLSRYLDSSPDWRRVASTSAGVIHVRRNTGAIASGERNAGGI